MDPVVAKVLAFAVVLTRVSVFLMVIPIFNGQAVPQRVRVSIMLLLSMMLALSMPTVVSIADLSFLQMLLLIVNEAVYGFALGQIVVLIFSVVKLAAQIVERQMGFAMAGTLDPLNGEEADAFSILIEMFFILLFLAANGHHLLILVIAKSYESFPAGQIPDLGAMVEGVVTAGSTMLMVCLRLAAPMLAAFLLLLVVLGVFARIIPEMDILFLSMPLRVGLGLLMAGMLFPFINQFVGEFSEWMGKLLPI
jgi:flagellar biosynthetic protein FliR